ncbi:hypothetical protein Hypma_005811 [Hypsizygus marmoreus]|uniref:Uncharacterized protein n=1 Tax=Hypsizygus marmoreus TaxID=39966 RepID=A0A369K7P5_HYPMA|nr:hypothetical protein Hypma_005811 [Hypsizygus marmoreus]
MQPSITTHTRLPIQALQFQFFDAMHYLEIAMMELQDFSDLHGEPGDDAFQPPQFCSLDNEDRLENLRLQRNLREADVYTAAAQLMRHSDFHTEDDTLLTPEVFPWRRHVPWRDRMRALRFVQRMVLEHAQATLLVLRHVGGEIHACRSDVNNL